MSKFFSDFEKDHNEPFTKGFFNGNEPFDVKIKFKPSENILLYTKLGFNYSYRIQNNEIDLKMNDGINAQTNF